MEKKKERIILSLFVTTRKINEINFISNTFLSDLRLNGNNDDSS